MARKDNQKLKLLYLLKILSENTDENHGLSVKEIIEVLEGYGISAERKSLYSDFEYLEEYGFEIARNREGREISYALMTRRFQTAELKLLVDAVQSAKFITEKKSRDLIKKIEGLASHYNASRLNRQVYVSGRVKTMNESIFYNVDSLYDAIADNRKITFKYYNWNLQKELEARHGGKSYCVSPWGLSWDDENYYLVAFDDTDRIIKHFRVDKMKYIVKTSESREGMKDYRNLDMAEYARKTFGMFGGEESLVTLECENSMVGVMIDRFGKDIPVMKQDDEHFRTTVRVALSMQFIGWVIGLSQGVKIVSPETAVDAVKEEIERLRKQYGV